MRHSEGVRRRRWRGGGAALRPTALLPRRKLTHSRFPLATAKFPRSVLATAAAWRCKFSQPEFASGDNWILTPVRAADTWLAPHGVSGLSFSLFSFFFQLCRKERERESATDGVCSIIEHVATALVSGFSFGVNANPSRAVIFDATTRRIALC